MNIVRLSITLMLLLALAGAHAAAPDWGSLNNDQQRILEQLKGRWNDMPAERRERLLKGVERWRKMGPEQRKHARENLRRWRRLPPRKNGQNCANG